MQEESINTAKRIIDKIEKKISFELNTDDVTYLMETIKGTVDDNDLSKEAYKKRLLMQKLGMTSVKSGLNDIIGGKK